MKFAVLSGVNCAWQKVIEIKVKKRLYTDVKEDLKSVFSFHFLPKAILIIRLREKKKVSLVSQTLGRHISQVS